jgi:hypothetical protein
MGLLIGALAIPWRIHPSPSMIYHISTFHCLLLAAWGAYAGLADIVRHRRAAIVGAAYFALNSDQMYHAFAHVNIAAPIFYLPALAVCVRLQNRPTLPWAALLSLAVFLQFLCSFYLGVMLLLTICVYTLGILMLRGRNGIHAAGAATGGLLVALVAAWLVFQPFAQLSTRLGNTRGLHEAARYSASLAGYLLPLTVEGFPIALPGLLARWAGVTYGFRLENGQWLGILFPTMTVLALMNLCRPEPPIRQRAIALLAVATTGFLLSLGPFLWWRDQLTGIRLPYAWLHEIAPPFRVMRAAARFALLVTLAVTVMGATWLAGSHFFNGGGLSRRVGLMVGILGLLALESLPVERPVLHPVDHQASQSLARHASGKIAAPIPLNDHRFLLAAARSFPVTPSATLDGVHNHHYRTILEVANNATPHGLLDLYEALDVQVVMIHDMALIPTFHATGRLEPLEAGVGFSLFRLRGVGGEAVESQRRWIARIPERPPLPAHSQFPPGLRPGVLWRPDHWQWLDESQTPPQWVGIPWDSMGSFDYIYRSLRGVHYSGLPPRPLSECARIHIRMRLSDPGVDFARCRVQWLTTSMSSWEPTRTAEASIRTDGKWQVVTLDLEAIPSWNFQETLTALQFEFTTTPHPGQRVRVSEIRLEPTSRDIHPGQLQSTTTTSIED